MDYPELQDYQQKRLDQALTEELKRNEEEFKTWREYKKRYKKVIEGLEAIPLEVSINCMVPVGKRALIKGKLTHTNEILVWLGEGYFVKYSAAQAIALCNRRIQHADEMIEKLEAERNLYEMKQFIPLEYDVFGKDERQDLAEYWDEKSLEDWRVHHRQREKEYHKKLLKIREEEKTKEKESDVSAEERLFRRLDELEIEEELAEEFDRLEEDDLQEGEEYYESAEEESSSEEVTIEELQKELQKLKDIRMPKETNNVEKAIESTVEKTSCNIVEISSTTENNTVEKVSHNTTKTTNTAEHDTVEKILRDTTEAAKTTELNNTLSLKTETAPESTTGTDKTETARNKRKIRFALSTDEDASNAGNRNVNAQSCKYENEDEIFRIDFTHSDNVPRMPEASDKIQTPADIYKVFMTPKSVLKKTAYSEAYNQNISTVRDLEIEEEEDSDEESNKISVYNTIVKDIQERKVEIPTQPPQEKEKKQFVSKFKKDRAGLKK